MYQSREGDAHHMALKHMAMALHLELALQAEGIQAARFLCTMAQLSID